MLQIDIRTYTCLLAVNLICSKVFLLIFVVCIYYQFFFFAISLFCIICGQSLPLVFALAYTSVAALEDGNSV